MRKIRPFIFGIITFFIGMLVVFIFTGILSNASDVPTNLHKKNKPLVIPKTAC